MNAKAEARAAQFDNLEASADGQAGKRAVQVDTWADLRIELEAKVARVASLWTRFAMLAVVALVVYLILGRRKPVGSMHT